MTASGTEQTVRLDSDDIDDLAKLKPLVTDVLPLANSNLRLSLVKIICGSTVTLVIVGIVSIVPILQLIIGWRYADECPINWRIPHYLVVAGVIGLAAVILTIIQELFRLYIKPRATNSDLSAPTITVVCALCIVLIVLFFIIIFLSGWLVAGCFWVVRAWNKVQYNNSDRSDYCNPTLYRSAFWLLFMSMLYYLLICVRAGNHQRQEFISRRRDNATHVPTTEP